jgi:hypothetical protein
MFHCPIRGEDGLTRGGIWLPGTGTCERSRSREDAKIPTRQKWNSTGKIEEGKKKRISQLKKERKWELVDLWIPACLLVALYHAAVLALPSRIGRHRSPVQYREL